MIERGNRRIDNRILIDFFLPIFNNIVKDLLQMFVLYSLVYVKDIFKVQAWIKSIKMLQCARAFVRVELVCAYSQTMGLHKIHYQYKEMIFGQTIKPIHRQISNNLTVRFRHMEV